MSRLNEGLYSSKEQGWMTPPDLIEALLEFEGRERFDLDACCSQFNIPARAWNTPEGKYMDYPIPLGLTKNFWDRAKVSNECGLKAKWEGLTFMNPPYGTMIEKFIKKAAEEVDAGRASVWMLLPVRSDTRYFHQYIFQKPGFCVFLKGRLKFIPPPSLAFEACLQYVVMSIIRVMCYAKSKPVPNTNAPFPAVLVYQGKDYVEKYQKWKLQNPLPGRALLVD